MRCEDFDELIYLFWDGRIDQRKKEKLEKHLSTCKRCKEKSALLESIEKGAKGIRIKEPSHEYWDTFSSRVRERIIAQKEEAFSFKLKKVFESIFTFSPLKIKVAAGVVSIVLVFVVGKLYVDYRGKEIVPPTRIESLKEPASYAPELEKEVTQLEEKVKKKEEVTPPHDELEKVVAPQIIPKEKTMPVTSLEEKVREKDEVTPPPDQLEKGVAPQIIPKEKITPEVVELKEEEVLLPEAYWTGAGAEKEKGMLEEIVEPEQKVKDQEGVSLKGKAKMAARKPLALDRAMETASVRNYYVMEGEEILKIEEEDTLLQEDVLRKTIESWNRYIEKNPEDSLTNEGYLQVAIGYYLLSKLTQDESDLLEGIELLEKYEKQVTNPKTKEELNKKLKQLKALKDK